MAGIGRTTEYGDLCCYGGTCDGTATHVVVQPAYPGGEGLDLFPVCTPHLGVMVEHKTRCVAGWGDAPAVAVYQLRPEDHDALGILARNLTGAGIK